MLAGWLVLWQGLVTLGVVRTSLVPSPGSILVRMLSLSHIVTVLPTFVWALAAWALGVCATVFLVIGACQIEVLNRAIAFLFTAGRTLPSVVAVPLFAATLGFNRRSSFFCAAALTACYAAPPLKDAIHVVVRSRQLFSEALGLTFSQDLRLVTLPGVGSALSATATHSFGIALVVTVAAEMILSLGGVGDRIGELAWLLRMQEAYALVAWLVLCSLVLNTLVRAIPLVLLLPSRAITRRIYRTHAGLHGLF